MQTPKIPEAQRLGQEVFNNAIRTHSHVDDTGRVYILNSEFKKLYYSKRLGTGKTQTDDALKKAFDRTKKNLLKIGFIVETVGDRLYYGNLKTTPSTPDSNEGKSLFNDT